MGSIVKTKVSNLPRVGDIQDFIVFGAERTTNHSAYADMVQLRGNRGEKILLRKGAAGIEYKYEEQPDSTYQLLIPYEAIKMLFSDLTAEEIEMLKLHFSDLTAADIAALQKPATDAADALEEYLVEKDAELTQLQTDTDAARLSAIEATESANDAIGEAEAATENANTAALAANNATSLANTATTEALAATENAIDAALTANNATSLAAAAALEAGSAAEEAEEATAAAEEATNEAKELTAHPPKIVSGEWWIYDLATHDYINTNLPSRGPEGKGPVVLPNGNYGNWNESAEEYEDSGIEAAATVNLDDVPVAFTEAEEIEPLVPGDTVPDALGKLSAWQSALGRVIFKAENKTTAAGTAAKVLTADEGYTPAEGDLLLVTWTINNSVGAPTFNINGVVYPVWFNGTNINSTTNITTQYTIAANSRVLYVFQDGKFHQVGSNIKYAVELCGVIHGGSAGRQIAQPITGYSFAMEGADGQFYPLHTGAYTNAATKPANTAEFKVGGLILFLGSTSTIAAGTSTSIDLRLATSMTASWNTYGLNGSAHLSINRMCYLKGSINTNDNFVLDNTSPTSFYTSELPTEDDGFVYIEFLRIGTANTRMYLPLTHAAWWFKDGQIRPYGVRKYTADEDGGLELSDDGKFKIDEATMRKIDYKPSQRTAVLEVSGWEEYENGYRYTIEDEDIDATQSVDVWPSDRDSQTALQDAEPDTLITVEDGKFILTAVSAPAAAINIIYETRWVKEN